MLLKEEAEDFLLPKVPVDIIMYFPQVTQGSHLTTIHGHQVFLGNKYRVDFIK